MKRKKLILAMTVMAIMSWTGCSGINASGSISPATFLLPGFLKNDAPPPNAPPPTGKTLVVQAD
tara:strand:+ start:255 stop:446 length:192 start_codon:yes stop_codon:yes gene_type:complete